MTCRTDLELRGVFNAVFFSIPVLILMPLLILEAGESPADFPTPPEAPEEAARRDEQKEQKYEGRTIEEWVADLGKGFRERQKAHRTLVAIGRPAVKPVLSVITERRKGTGQAFETLGEMGEVAREALPIMMRIAGDPDWKEPDGWTWNVSPRYMALSGLREMSWASEELIPFFRDIAGDETEPENLRRRAVGALGGMGEKAAPVLRAFTRSEDAEIREAAHLAMVRLLSLDPKEYFAQVLEDDPCDVNARSYLAHTKGTYNSGRLDRLTEKVKTAMRERLARAPEPELAWVLLSIIQDQLSGTSLQWAAPTDSSSARSDREDPKENFGTLAKVARMGFRSAEEGSELWRRFGVGLARLHLLEGDWEGMNRMLVELGQKPIPEERRPLLAAPPVEWKEDLAEVWDVSDESMRSGTCGLVFRFEKDGKGLRGVHVLVKEAPKPQKVFRSGIPADTLFLSPLPFDRFLGSFGYRTPDRKRTRYAVSDSRGIVRFEKLPLMEVKIEVLVPTASFREAAPAWELWMRMEDGTFLRASTQPGGDRVSPNSPPGKVQLVEGEVVEYPLLVVRPRFELNVHDWARVDKDSFTLAWSADPSGRQTRYEIEMAVSAPQQHPSYDPNTPALRTAKEVLRGSEWPVGRRGVGGLQLEPGNIYTLQVTAFASDGAMVARSRRLRVWVPWPDRRCDPPVTDWQPSGGAPITHGKWWRGSSSYADGRRENLREQIVRFLRERPNAFEREYQLLGNAWLDWRDENTAAAGRQLAELVEKLPERNVARATAKWLLESLESGGQCPKRLNFRDR